MKDFKINLTNYTFKIPGNRSIVIMANYRTGSTAFGDLLSKLTGLPFLGEVFHYNLSSRPAAYDTNQQSVIKIMPNHMPPEDHWDSLFNKSYIIGLYREDFAAQVLSYAVSYHLGKWQQEKNADVVVTDPEMALRLTDAQLQSSIQILRKTDAEWNECKEYFDIILSYENIKPDLDKSAIGCFPKITTYNETLTRLRSII
jgi:LPS sulfotransferase NodH